MSPHRWQDVKAVLEQALEHDPGDARQSFVAQTCARDEDLRKTVETYLETREDKVEACAENLRHSLLSRLWTDPVGRRLGAYRIERELGRGGMGAVYLAARADGQFEKLVAIKLLKRGTDTDEILQRFRAERQILARLEHPSIARLLDAGTSDEGLPYFVMEYVSGIAVTQFVTAHDSSFRDRLDLFLKICAAVESAHQQSVVHRDLKPTNILVTAEGEPKLLDFGIAKLVDEGEEPADLTATRHQRLTPSYASPEQARGGAVTARSDVFALGALLYELVTGKTPHSFSSARPSFEEVARVLKEHQPEPPSRVTTNPEFRQALQGCLDKVILHALNRNPDERYSSVAEFSNDIRRYLANQPVTVPVGQSARRNLVRLAVAALMVTALIVAAVTERQRLLPLLHRPVNKSPVASSSAIHSLAVLPFESLRGSNDEPTLSLGMADAIIGRMSGLQNIVVLPTGSISHFKGSPTDAVVTGRMLNVDAILCGTVQRAGDRVRVTVQLVNVKTRQTLWSNTFDETFTDIFGIQDVISKKVAQSLAVNLSPEDQQQLTKHNTSDTDAYNFYLLGLSSYNLRTKQGLADAIKYFQKAIEKDANYAMAYAKMADCYFLQSYYSYEPKTESIARAHTAAENALRIDSSLAEGYLALAMVQPMPDPKGETERLLKHAIELNPNLAVAHQRYAWRLSNQGHLKHAIAEMKRAQELDPLSPTNNTALGIMYSFSRQYDLTLKYCSKAAELNPKEPFTQNNLSFAYLVTHHYPEAIAQLDKTTKLAPEGEPDNEASVVLALLGEGKIKEANELFQRVLASYQQGKVQSYSLTLDYLALGNVEEAFKYFEKALAASEINPSFLRYDESLDPLRADSRFKTLLRKYHYVLIADASPNDSEDWSP